ncbi:hypothetical protein ATN79_07535 [Paraburkholderia caribensis]|nr:hypothetical protein ATN79_07535 [Paraburkholderia caribensis]
MTPARSTRDGAGMHRRRALGRIACGRLLAGRRAVRFTPRNGWRTRIRIGIVVGWRRRIGFDLGWHGRMQSVADASR